MKILVDVKQSLEIAQFLKVATSIAIVGLSPKENRPSNMVAKYLIEKGFEVIPVNPGQEEILGIRCYRDLLALPHPVDIVDIFRNSEDVLPIVQQTVLLRQLPKAIWMQQGVVNETAAELARSKGIFVVMDRCIKIDHENLVDR